MKRSALNVILNLSMLLKPLIPIMLLAILTGVLGFLSAILIPVLGGCAILVHMKIYGLPLRNIYIMMLSAAALRGIFRYIEQESNHYIAFKILAIIRDKVFAALRRLTPAKLENRDKGDMLTILTRDIELLEVFYAHTISPVCIALILSIIMTAFLWHYHYIFGIIALASYITLGIIIPRAFSKSSEKTASLFSEKYADINSFFLDSLKGVKQSLQYESGDIRMKEFQEMRKDMEECEGRLKENEGRGDAVNGAVIYAASIINILAGAYLYMMEETDIAALIICEIALFSSFGAVIAVSKLGTGLSKTIASGRRVLELLSEEPLVRDIENGRDITFSGAEFKNVSFSYTDELILDNINLNIEQGKILGIIGKSGSGKSTLLKLLMRFWDRDKGSIDISGNDIKTINTSSLRDMESYLTQETMLFNDSIENNIKIAKLSASEDEIIDAAKKASIHEFIMRLPNGYKSNTGELGDNLSEGEKQRLGLARAFLHDSALMLLDEPTSNIDSLNEAVILRAVKEDNNKTTVIVSHRLSTMGIADTTVAIDCGRLS
jgi:hypothetical protein